MRWLALWLAVGVLVLTAFRYAVAQDRPLVIPPPCADLAAREGKPIPTNAAEAKSARRKLAVMTLVGDRLALDCWRALKVEKHK